MKDATAWLFRVLRQAAHNPHDLPLDDLHEAIAPFWAKLNVEFAAADRDTRNAPGVQHLLVAARELSDATQFRRAANVIQEVRAILAEG